MRGNASGIEEEDNEGIEAVRGTAPPCGCCSGCSGCSGCSSVGAETEATVTVCVKPSALSKRSVYSHPTSRTAAPDPPLPPAPPRPADGEKGRGVGSRGGMHRLPNSARMLASTESISCRLGVSVCVCVCVLIVCGKKE